MVFQPILFHIGAIEEHTMFQGRVSLLSRAKLFHCGISLVSVGSLRIEFRMASSETGVAFLQD